MKIIFLSRITFCKFVNLFIVESPAKAKTIGQYLGKDFIVLASYGHIRELVKQNGSVDVDHNFDMKYQLIEKARPQVAKIAEYAKKANKIYLASDPDREGEAISQSIYEVLIAKKVATADKFLRVTYTEITKHAIENAINNPRKIDANLVDAQLSRQALDYLVGFNLSPVLWRKLPGSKSAGRVQSVALRMIVDREFEIKKFVPIEYWTINSKLLTKKNEKVDSRVVKFNGKNFEIGYPKNEEEAEVVSSFLEKIGEVKIVKNEKKDIKQNPCPPFTTALLQQDAVRKLGFSSKKTMSLAQRLYEGVSLKGKTIALITYMRTDGMTLSDDALKNIRSLILTNFGNDYLPSKAIAYKTKAKNAQEAHEAIRPAHIDIRPQDVKDEMEYDMWRLYDLIWKRTLACQMTSAIYSRQSVDFVASDDKNELLARTTGNKLKFNGYLAAYNISNESYEEGDEDNSDALLPDLEVGDKLKVDSIKKEQHFTSPPPRYSEASLIKMLESYGIGRPSTYATIIFVLQDREYVALSKRYFTPTSRGIIVSVFLKQFFSKYVEYGFTAKLEEDLDLISDGKVARIDFLYSFWKDFHKNVEDILNTKYDVIFAPLNKIFVEYFLAGDTKCPQCGNEISLKSSKYGIFFGCNNYPNCKYMCSLSENNGTTNASDGNNNTENSIQQNNVQSLSSNQQTIEHPKYGKIIIKNGRYGRYCEVQKNGKSKNYSLPSEGELTDEIFDFYLNLPIVLGKDKEGIDVTTNIGRYGPYILYKSKFYSYTEKPYSEITLNKALETIAKMQNRLSKKNAVANEKTKKKIFASDKSSKNVGKKKKK